MDYVCIFSRYNGKPALTLHMLELAVAKGEPINFDIYGHQSRYVPERTCKMVPKVLSDDGIITHVAFNCSACGNGRNFPTYVDFTDKIGTAEDVIRTHVTVGYCEDCGAKVVGENEK